MNVPENGGKDRIYFVKYYARSRVQAHILTSAYPGVDADPGHKIEGGES